MKKHYCSIVLLILLFVSCARKECQMNDVQESYSLEQGKEIKFSLLSNSTTGYAWYWINKDNTHIQLNHQEYKICSGMGGGGGYEDFEFEGSASGKDSLVLEYKQSWIADSVNTDITRRVIQVEVK